MKPELDIIIYGASGYTGRLVAEYLVQKGDAVKWAMAGRDQAKLREVRELINAPTSIPIIVADADDVSALTAMVKRTAVVLTTAGPYQRYGNALVKACAEMGTDYVDLAGESNWIAKKIVELDATAKRSGARLIFSSGFDSVPFDLGVLFVEHEAKKLFGTYAPRVRGRVRVINGGLSGGTLDAGKATTVAIGNDASILEVIDDPFALTPGFKGSDQPDLNATYEDKVMGAWVKPFGMARINTKTVHRSNFLLGHLWGIDFQYDEMSVIDPSNENTSDFDINPSFQPGEGPTQKQREEGFYDVLFIAEYPDGCTLKASVKGDRDPGYGSTAKIIAESALCLGLDISRDQTSGGCWTPTSAMGEALINRLQESAGLIFSVES